MLDVERGLNDAIATPVVTFGIASAATVLGMSTHHDEAGFGALEQLAVGLGVGAGIALAGGRLLEIAHRRGWMQHGTRRLATLKRHDGGPPARGHPVHAARRRMTAAVVERVRDRSTLGPGSPCRW